MPKRNESPELESDEIVDSDASSSSESEPVPKAKKSKNESKGKCEKNGNSKKEEKKNKSNDGNKPLRGDLGKKKFVTISNFKGKRYVDIREWYEDRESGEDKPGKKGISLDLDQWKKLKTLIEQVDAEIEDN